MDAGAGCPLQTCGKKFSDEETLRSHIVKFHHIARAKVGDYMAQWKEQMGMSQVPAENAAQRVSEASPVAPKDKEENVKMVNVADRKKGEDEGADDLDEVQQLEAVLKDNGIRNYRAIVRNYQYHDLDDLERLNELLAMAGVVPNKRKLVLDTWGSMRNLEPLKIETALKRTQDDGEDEKDEKEDEVDAIEEMSREMDKAMLKNLKRAQAALQLREMAKRLKESGLDPRDYNLPDVSLPNSEKKPEEEDAEYGEYEYPPNSGKTVRMKHERYNQLLMQWNKAHGIVQAEEKKDDKVPWTNPYTNEVVEVERSKYIEYMKISENYYSKNGKTTDPLYDDLKRTMEDIKKDNEQLRNALAEKERKELEGQIGYVNSENEKLKKKLDDIEHRDKLDESLQSITKFRSRAQELGLAPAGRTVAEEATLKRMDTQSLIQTKAIDAIATKVSSSKIGTGAIADGYKDVFTKIVEKAVDGGLLRSRYPVMPHSEDELIRMQANMEKVEMNAQRKPKQEPEAPKDPLPQTPPVQNPLPPMPNIPRYTFSGRFVTGNTEKSE